LNLEACIWEFDNYYDMSELQQACGGEITTDGQVKISIKIDEIAGRSKIRPKN